MAAIIQLFILVLLPAILVHLFRPLLHTFEESIEILGTRESVGLLEDLIEEECLDENVDDEYEDEDDEYVSQISRWLLREGHRNLLELADNDDKL